MNKVVLFTLISLFYFVSRASEINIAAHVEVSKASTYSLADIVEVTSPSIEFLQTLRSEKIVLSEGMGLEDLRRIVRESRMQNGIFRDARWKLPSTFSVELKNDFSEKQFSRMVLNEMRMHCAECKIEMKSINAQNRKIALNWSIETSGIKLQNSQLIQVIDGGGQVVWIPANFRIYTTALVANKLIPMGTRIMESDLVRKQVELGYIREMPLQNLDKLEGFASRSLSPGSLVLASDFKKEPATKKGQSVQVLSGTADFEIRISGIAEESGSIGDMVKVKSLESNKILSGIVTGKNEVRIQ